MVWYKAELRSIDAWKEDGCWQWNCSYLLEDGLFFSDDSITPRKVLKTLRKWEYLNAYSIGKVRVVEQWPVIEIQNNDTGCPILALMFSETEYTDNGKEL